MREPYGMLYGGRGDYGATTQPNRAQPIGRIAIMAETGTSNLSKLPSEKGYGGRFTEAGAFISLGTMWNVEERFAPKAIESLAALGFAVGSTRGVVRVEKYGSGAEFRKGTDDLYQMTIVPTQMLKGRVTEV